MVGRLNDVMVERIFKKCVYLIVEEEIEEEVLVVLV